MSEDNAARLQPQIAEILQTSYAIDTSRCIPLHGGRMNRLWRQDQRVIKVYDESRVPRQRAEQAMRLQADLAALGLPVPSPAPTRQGQLWADSPVGMVVVMPMMPGQRRSRGSLSRDEAANLGGMLGSLHQALRGLTPSDASCPTRVAPDTAIPDAVALRERWAGLRQKALATEPMGDFDRAVADAAAYAIDALARVPAADWSDQPYQLCHGDMHLDNVLFDEAGRVSGVIDFDNVALGWAGFEVMMAWNLGLNADAGAPSLSPEAAEFFRQYRATSGLSTRQIAESPLLYWHRLVSNTWPASLRYKSECAPEPAWLEILSLRFRTARWLEENHARMAEWLSDRR